ncbi:PmoA family protein [Nonomuraea angiospora]|nr:DUF6807 family protein [Nonomuraea angiospora]MDX3109008.1 PmoA family protein [Nonomuraea angiospora]
MSAEVLRLDGREVAIYVWQPEAPASSSPRPFLHPVRTLAGRTVTDAVGTSAGNGAEAASWRTACAGSARTSGCCCVSGA